jgi:hypothetical protein
VPNPDIGSLVREADHAHGRYVAATVEINRLEENLRAVEVVHAAVEEEAMAARAIGGFRSER